MKKVEVFFLVALLMLSVQTTGRADAPIWCYDACTTGCVFRRNARLRARCKQKCRIECDIGARG
ncbi:hypothetical protein AMTRI_Chr03g146260 [Amborella trichopoda]